MFRTVPSLFDAGLWKWLRTFGKRTVPKHRSKNSLKNTYLTTVLLIATMGLLCNLFDGRV